MPEVSRAEQRKKLVLAAEAVMKQEGLSKYFASAKASNGGSKSQRDDRWKVEKSQLNQLIGVCGEALCVEEIENYLRYQGSRERPSWGLELVKCTLEKIDEILQEFSTDREKVEAWRYYAVFLARAFTYQKAAAGSGRNDAR